MHSLLQPRTYLSASSQSQSQSHTSAVESGIHSPSASASVSGPVSGSAASLTRSQSPVPPNNSINFFSRTPDDIRANTVQLSMLAPPPPRVHSNYLCPREPSSFPPPRAWTPPSDLAEESVVVQNAAPAFSYISPQQIRTPLTASDLARLGSPYLASVARSGAQRSHVRDREHTFAHEVNSFYVSS